MSANTSRGLYLVKNCLPMIVAVLFVKIKQVVVKCDEVKDCWLFCDFSVVYLGKSVVSLKPVVTTAHE